jgi:predicted permease
LKILAGAQIAFSFVLLAGAGTLVAALVALQTADTGLNMRQVLAFDLPSSSLGIRNADEMDFYQQVTRRIEALPGVEEVALGSVVPWRDAGLFPRFPFAVEGHSPTEGEERPHARLRLVAPRFFSVLGVPLVGGREFTDDDRAGSERVVIVSESVARRLFPNGEALNGTLWWTDPLLGERQPRRIVGIVADVDDERVVQGPVLTIYHPVRQMHAAGRLFVRVEGDPYTFVPVIRRVIQDLSPEQPVERPATLEDVRAEVLAPDRLNAFVLSGFAGVALLIAVVGVCGVLAFSVSARTREFGVRLALGSSPRQLLCGVLFEGAFIVALGIGAGIVSGYAFATVAATAFEGMRLPGAFAAVGAAAVLAGAAVIASLMPAARASRVDVLQALRVD